MTKFKDAENRLRRMYKQQYQLRHELMHAFSTDRPDILMKLDALEEAITKLEATISGDSDGRMVET